MPYVQIFTPEIAETQQPPISKISVFISDEKLEALADVIQKYRSSGFIVNITQEKH